MINQGSERSIRIKYSLSHLIPKDQCFQGHRFQNDSFFFLFFFVANIFEVLRLLSRIERPKRKERSASRADEGLSSDKLAQVGLCGCVNTG